MTCATSEVSITGASSISATVQTQSQKPDIMSVGASAISTAEANGTIPAEGRDLVVRPAARHHRPQFQRIGGQGLQQRGGDNGLGTERDGSRTFVIDVNGSMAQTITSGSFEILFDGQQISEASSLSAVLSPQAGTPATYTVVHDLERRAASGLSSSLLDPRHRDNWECPSSQ